MEKIKEDRDSITVPLEVGSATLYDGFKPRDLIQISIARSLMRIAEVLEALNHEKV